MSTTYPERAISASPSIPTGRRALGRLCAVALLSLPLASCGTAQEGPAGTTTQEPTRTTPAQASETPTPAPGAAPTDEATTDDATADDATADEATADEATGGAGEKDSQPEETGAEGGTEDAMLTLSGRFRVQGQLADRPGNWHIGMLTISGGSAADFGQGVNALTITDYDCPDGVTPQFPGGEGSTVGCAEVGVSGWWDDFTAEELWFGTGLDTVTLTFDGEVSDWSTVPVDNLPATLTFEAAGEREATQTGAERPVRPVFELEEVPAEAWDLVAMYDTDEG